MTKKQISRMMLVMARILDYAFRDYRFALLVFPLKEGEPVDVDYISNAPRLDVLRIMHDFIWKALFVD